MGDSNLKHLETRETRSYLMAREPSVDRRFRPCPERQVCLFQQIQEDPSDSEHFESEDTSTGISSGCDTISVDDVRAVSTLRSYDSAEGAAIYLRMRPVGNICTKTYAINDAGSTLIVNLPQDVAGTSKSKKTVETHYNFSKIFDHFVQQHEVYEQCVYQKINDEENFSMLAYGTSGSGKTFTLLGEQENPGIIPRAIEHIFTLYNKNIYQIPAIKLINSKVKILDDVEVNNEIKLRSRLLAECVDINDFYERMHEKIKADGAFETRPLQDVAVVIWISFAELYNEIVFDLLEEPVYETSTTSFSKNKSRNHLKIMSNNGKIFIKGLTSIFVKDNKEALQLLRYGLKRVNYASTKINENSSRSHCIFFIDILKYHRNGEVTENSYKFCDMAGSERLVKTGNVGKRLKEAQSINTSLLVLGRCLDIANSNRLKKSSDVIPVRESKLTLLLQSALLGKEKLAMVVTVTPTQEYYEENLHVLGFSSIAKNILYKQNEVSYKRTRYSLSLINQTASTDTSEVLDRLLRENNFKQSIIDQLRAENQAQLERHREELRQQECRLRNHIADNFQEVLRKRDEDFENRLRSELDCLRQFYEHKIELLEQQHQDELEDALEEYEDKENKSDTKN